MNPVEIKTTTTTSVEINGTSVNDVLRRACDLAHSVLEELSMYRQDNGIDNHFDCEGEACEFLDFMGD